MEGAEPHLQSYTLASQALPRSWQVLLNRRAAAGRQAPDIPSPGGCYSAPGSRGSAALGADAPAAADSPPHAAPRRLHLGRGRGRQTARRSRPATCQGQPRAAGACPPCLGSQWPEMTSQDPSADPSRCPAHGKAAFGLTQTSCWEGGSRPASYSERSLLSGEFRP